MHLRLRSLTKTYPAPRGQSPRPALHEVSLALERGEILGVIGPSGAGKTTLLSLLAGLEALDSGTIEFETPPSRKRPVIMVFQEFLLFPHLTVFENVAFGLRARGLRKTALRDKVDAMLAEFQMTDKRVAYPDELSAGQRQRVALARALVLDPALLLLDEPFANLDPGLKLQTAAFLRATQRRHGVTTLCVTHDLPEAFALCDRLGLLLDGRLVQCGPAREIYEHPASEAAAAFLGPVNRLSPQVARQLGLPESAGELLVRPEAIALFPDPAGQGQVRQVAFAGQFFKYAVLAFGQEFQVHSLADGLAPGDRVALRVLRSLPQPSDISGSAS